MVKKIIVFLVVTFGVFILPSNIALSAELILQNTYTGIGSWSKSSPILTAFDRDIYKYQYIVELSNADASKELGEVVFEYNDGINNEDKSITLNSNMKTIVIDLETRVVVNSHLYWTNYSIKNNRSNQIVNVRLQRERVYEPIAGTAVGTPNGNISSQAKVEISDSFFYDYYLGYLAAIERESGIAINHKVKLNGSYILNGAYKNDYEFYDMYRLNLVDGKNVIDIESTVTSSSYTSWGQLKIFKKKKYDIEVEITPEYRYIGDNTQAMVNLLIKGDKTVGNLIVEIYKTEGGAVVYSALLRTVPGTAKIDVAGEGDISFSVRIRDSLNRDIFTGNAITISKLNVLNSLLNEASMNNSLDKFLILDDKDRFYEENEKNINLIKGIKEKSNYVYLIADNISPVFKPLLES